MPAQPSDGRAKTVDWLLFRHIRHFPCYPSLSVVSIRPTMTTLLPFLAALSDASRLRLLFLAQEHKITVAELRPILGLGDGELAAHLKQLVEIGLIKAGKGGTKKDSQSQSDAKKLHDLRHKKPAKSAKPAKKAATKKKAAK
jgi:DNA-binding transcriptional ArsR family regulator